ncbi:hypothetical protein EST38_g12194 [Candolleomyces aberdarensis]|uniref:Uncharacterized protein n=1 Tax=Candolleomyces aberdarensis TaxID=2316362 RepID=A0A4Q2D3R3_9AGAR|nr:hypothetical protein EST38_g12194 [Candolleomyces aberdarensis]
MVEAIRHPDTLEGISQVQWDVIRTNGAAIVREDLMTLPDPPNPITARGKGHTAEWFIKNYPKQWAAAIGKFEAQEPILTYCGGSWKAQATFRVVLRTLKNTDDRAASGSDTEHESGSPTDGKSLPAAKKRRRHSLASSRKKLKEGGTELSAQGQSDTNLQSVVNGSPSGSQSHPASSTLNNAELHHQLSEPLSSSGGPLASDTANTSKVDTSFIQIDHSFETLKDEFSQCSTPVPFANELLAALEHASSKLIESFNEESSSEALAFLEGIEDADPNSCGFHADDDDNNNAGWGHYQFTAGGHTIKHTLSTWAAVGSVTFASKLLAAALRTCKVARHLCEIRERSASSYISDAYLANVVEHLWEIIPPSFKAEENSGTSTSEEAGDPDALAEASHLQKLQVSEMKSWVLAHSIEVPAGWKKRSREDFIKIVLNADVSKRPNLQDVASILNARAAGKAKKGAGRARASTP